MRLGALPTTTVTTRRLRDQHAVRGARAGSELSSSARECEPAGSKASVVNSIARARASLAHFERFRDFGDYPLWACAVVNHVRVDTGHVSLASLDTYQGVVQVSWGLPRASLLPRGNSVAGVWGSSTSHPSTRGRPTSQAPEASDMAAHLKRQPRRRRPAPRSLRTRAASLQLLSQLRGSGVHGCCFRGVDSGFQECAH